MKLRPYQQEAYLKVREAFRGVQRVCMQLPTGAGKTAVFTSMAATSSSRGWNTWIVVPRNELLQQASDSLLGVGVKHGVIAAGRYESRAYDVHVVSKDTLTRRLDKNDVRRPPQLLIVDEAHLALDRYLAFAAAFPEAKMLGVTATPERLDGRGLSELYQRLVLGPQIPFLIEKGFLSPCRYFSPPIDGLDKVRRVGTEYNSNDLDELLKTRRVYGEAIEHYRRHADHRPALVYCRSVQAADDTAQRFCAAGYRFANIDGTMTYAQRKMLINGLKTGELDGLTSCELITYGLDVPRVECVIMLRPTMSRALFMQMVGRGLRVWPGKTDLIVLDHVGNLQEHGHPFADHDWNFDGTERRKRDKHPEVPGRLCPEIDYLWCDKASCVGCEHNKSGRKERKLEVVEADLVEAESPVKLAARPPDERDVIEAAIGREVGIYTAEVTVAADAEITDTAKGAIGRLLAIAAELGNNPMWVYWKLSAGRVSVNVPLLFELQRQAGYKVGWAWWKQKEVRESLMRRRKKEGDDVVRSA